MESTAQTLIHDLAYSFIENYAPEEVAYFPLVWQEYSSKYGKIPVSGASLSPLGLPFAEHIEIQLVSPFAILTLRATLTELIAHHRIPKIENVCAAVNACARELGAPQELAAEIAAFAGPELYDSFQKGDFENLISSIESDKEIETVKSVGFSQQQDFERIIQEYEERKKTINRTGPFQEVVGRSATILDVIAQMEQVIDSDTTVLLTGETGVGKDCVARALHDASGRKHGEFINVNLAALPVELVETELFGHEEDAFTGSKTLRKGRFERANGGTLFLNEIGEIDPKVQPKLLRVLENKTIERLGGSKAISVDVRLICATNKNLEEAIEEGLFRRDLYYRINDYRIQIPPLRERREDIPLLVHHFVRLFCENSRLTRKTVSPDAMRRFCLYEWPGNVRELKSCIGRAVHNSKDETKIEPQHIILYTGSGNETKRTRIMDALRRSSTVSEAADKLGISRATLYNKCTKYNIEDPSQYTKRHR